MKQITILLLLLFASNLLFRQNSGDYRSVNSGPWTTLSNWQTFNGTSWVPATNYPGSIAGNYDVSVSLGNTISSPPARSYSFGDFYVYGTFSVSTAAIFSTTDKLIIDGGIVMWRSNVALTLGPENATVSVWNFDPSIPNGLQGLPCNNNKVIYLGSVRYAVCAGGGNADYIFDDINYAGGSITAEPDTTPSQLCLGGTFNLTGIILV